MPKKKRTPIDSTPYSTVVVCPHERCPWREITHDRHRAWYALARHLKHSHGDLQATKRARQAGWVLEKSAKLDT